MKNFIFLFLVSFNLFASEYYYCGGYCAVGEDLNPIFETDREELTALENLIFRCEKMNGQLARNGSLETKPYTYSSSWLGYSWEEAAGIGWVYGSGNLNAGTYTGVDTYEERKLEMPPLEDFCEGRTYDENKPRRKLLDGTKLN